MGTNHLGILKGCAEQMPVFQMAANVATNFVETVLGLSNSCMTKSDVFNMELLGVSVYNVTYAYICCCLK